MKTTLDRNDSGSKRHLIETTLDRIIKEKIYNFESVPVFSIFCLENIVTSKKKDLHFAFVPILSISFPKNIVIPKKDLPFKTVSHFFKGSSRRIQGWGHGTIPLPN